MSDGGTSVPRVLVTGASGQFGRVLRYGLARHAPDMTVMYHGRTARQMGSGKWQFLDVQAPVAEWADFIAAIRPDVVLHLAGVIHSRNVSEQEMTQINAACTVKIAQAAAASNVRHFFFASSAAIYGVQPEAVARLVEAGPADPVSAYGRSKLAAEQMMAQAALGGMGVTALRYATTAGSDQLLLNALGRQSDTPLTLHRFDNGRGAERSYLGPDDLAHYHMRLFSKGAKGMALPQALNIATPGSVFMDQLLEQIATCSGQDIPWAWGVPPEGAIKRCVLSTELLDTTIGRAQHADALQALSQQVVAFFRSDYRPVFEKA